MGNDEAIRLPFRSLTTRSSRGRSATRGANPGAQPLRRRLDGRVKALPHCADVEAEDLVRYIFWQDLRVADFGDAGRAADAELRASMAIDGCAKFDLERPLPIKEFPRRLVGEHALTCQVSFRTERVAERSRDFLSAPTSAMARTSERAAMRHDLDYRRGQPRCQVH